VKHVPQIAVHEDGSIYADHDGDGRYRLWLTDDSDTPLPKSKFNLKWVPARVTAYETEYVEGDAIGSYGEDGEPLEL
jgi:hypothetical protein